MINHNQVTNSNQYLNGEAIVEQSRADSSEAKLKIDTFVHTFY